MEHKVSILTVNYNSTDFIELSLYALKKLTKNSFKVFIVDNNSAISEYNKLQKILSQYDNVHLERHTTDLRGSMAHGTALNHLVKMVKTPYFSILDADATWLRKNWDEILINRLNDQIKVVGSQAPIVKPQDFPLMFSIMFETATFQKLDIDFRPKDLEQRQDTGHEMRGKYLERGFKGLNLDVRNSRNHNEGPFARLVGIEEYSLGGDFENILSSHFGRGSTLGAQKYKQGIYKLPLVGPYLVNKVGKREKQQWIEICKQIIDKQV